MALSAKRQDVPVSIPTTSQIAFADATLALGGKTIIENLNLGVRPGEFLCIVGASGCGKTTALRLAAGLYQPTRGAVTFDGQPMLQLIVKLQTGNPDLNDPDDDGVRALYVKGKNLTAAIREAVKSAGAKSLEVGGKLSVTYTGDGEKTNKAFNAPKEYSATYTAPNASEDFLADPWASAEETKTNGLNAAQQAALEAAGLA